MTIAAPRHKPLTEREIAVLTLLAEGLSSSQIANQLYIGTNTVRSHKMRIFQKLGAKTSAQAVAIGSRKEILL